MDGWMATDTDRYGYISTYLGTHLHVSQICSLIQIYHNERRGAGQACAGRVTAAIYLNAHSNLLRKEILKLCIFDWGEN